jgi:hypothetical protein
MPRKLIIKNSQSPGDIVMLTAAVRDLHAHYPGWFLTDVRTPCPHLWENNPHLTVIADDDPEAEAIECEYPLIHRSNQQPWHFLHGQHIAHDPKSPPPLCNLWVQMLQQMGMEVGKFGTSNKETLAGLETT